MGALNRAGDTLQTLNRLDVVGDSLRAVNQLDIAGDASRTINRADALYDSSRAIPTSCLNSFSADTEVSTDEGDKPISQIQIGDYVLAWDEETNMISFYPVTYTIHHTDETIVNPSTSAMTISVWVWATISQIQNFQSPILPRPAFCNPPLSALPRAVN